MSNDGYDVRKTAKKSAGSFLATLASTVAVVETIAPEADLAGKWPILVVSGLVAGFRWWNNRRKHRSGRRG